MKGPEKAAKWWVRTLRQGGMSSLVTSKLENQMQSYLEKGLQKGKKSFFLFCDSGPRTELKTICENSGVDESGVPYFPKRARMRVGKLRVEVSVGIGEPWKIL